MKRKLITFILALYAVVQAGAQQTMTAEGAWCWFADPRALHYENASGTINMSWIGYIDVHGNIKATQVDFNRNLKTDVLVRSYFQPDDHNNPTFLVLPDERVLVIYSRHTDERAFYYRVSARPGDITTLGAEKKITTTNNTTYPSPFILSDDPEHFYLCWRGINWHPTIARITLPDANDDVSVDWGPYQIVQSTGARPYAKYYSNGKDKLYMTYTTGHPDNEQPNWVYFNVININATAAGNGQVTVNPTLNDITGKQLSVVSNGAFNVNKQASYLSSYPNTVVDAPSNLRDWVWQIALDKEEKPRIAMVKINGAKTQHEYFYARWTGTEWKLTDLADGGGKFHSSNTEYCYSGGMSLDPQNPSDVYLSKPTNGAHGSVFEIWKYSVADDGSVVSEQLTKDSEKNNVRPFVLPGSQSSPLRLAWMYGDYAYWMVSKNYPTGYPTSIRWDYHYALNTESRTVASAAFTISASVKLDAANYKGVLMATDQFTYELDEATSTPYLKVGNTVYWSTNRLLTSDNWAINSTGTSGDNWPTKMSAVHLTITYDGERLKVYRNGFLDQNVEVTLPQIEEAQVGGVAPAALTISRRDALADEVLGLVQETALGAIALPAEAHTDVVLPSTVNGEAVRWTSDHPEIIAEDGTFTAPAQPTPVLLTAASGYASRQFAVLAQPRDLGAALRASYTFDADDVFEQAGQKYVKSHTERAADLQVMGSASVDGTLNLLGNTASGFATNGYALAPAALMDSLRSYSFLLDMNAVGLANAPRLYDFGFSSGNSLFLRANALSAGIKYSGGTTTMTNASSQLAAATDYHLAVTFDAKTKTTSIYVDGVLVASGKENQREAYELALLSSCNRNYIGRTQWWDSSVASSNVDFCGAIDNFRLYDVCLTPEEVKEMLQIETPEEPVRTEIMGVVVNPGFEEAYAVMEGSGVRTDRALYLPEGWEVAYSNRNENDLSIVTSADLYASLLAEVPAAEGNASYRIRQNWGTSTISLTQQLVALPAGVYSIDAQVWQSGLGGKAEVSVTAAGAAPANASPAANATAWQTVSVPFICNGEQSVVLALSAIHDTNGSAKLIGFDDVRLFEQTSSATQQQLFSLLTAMRPQAQNLLDQIPSDQALASAIAAVDATSEATQQGALYAVFVDLREAIEQAKATYTSIDRIDASTQMSNRNRMEYDLSGRRANGSVGKLKIINGQKVLLK